MIRAPHHTSPFAAEGGWADKALAAAIIGGLLAIAAAIGARLARGTLRRLWLTLSVVALGGPLAVGLSWADHDTALLGKFYLFRPASPLLLLSLYHVCGGVRGATVSL